MIREKSGSDGTNEPSHSSDRNGGVNLVIDPLALTRLLFKRRRWIVGLVGLAAALAVTLTLLTPNRYASTATILPTGNSTNFSALRAMAGLTGGFGIEDGSSSALFPVVLNSRRVVDSLLARTYRVDVDGSTIDMTLPEYFGLTDPDKLRFALRGITSISDDNRSGEIRLSVETRYPDLSQALAGEYLRQLEEYNLYARTSGASDRVRYLERELSHRETELGAAEDSLAAFQSRNRNWAATSSPPLLKQLGRLTRVVEVESKMYAYLVQEYEIAKLDVQKDVPIIRILDGASLPTQKSGPFRSIIVLTVTAIALVLVVVGVFAVELVRDYLAQADHREKDEVIADLQTAYPRLSRLTSTMKSRLTREELTIDA